jgi:hypothetical protein
MNLENGKHEITYGSWGGSNPYETKAVDHDSKKRKIPRNGVIILGSEGGGYPVRGKMGCKKKGGKKKK